MIFKGLTVFFSTIILMPTVGAEQIEKASNSDLRSGLSSKFTVESIKANQRVELVQNDNSFVLLYLKKQQEANRKRLSVEEAEKIDQMFLSKFFQLKYSYPTYAGKKCDAAMKLSVRDDLFSICREEKDKLELGEAVFQDLRKFF